LIDTTQTINQHARITIIIVICLKSNNEHGASFVRAQQLCIPRMDE
jgi:hypothetical protein